MNQFERDIASLRSVHGDRLVWRVVEDVYLIYMTDPRVVRVASRLNVGYTANAQRLGISKETLETCDVSELIAGVQQREAERLNNALKVLYEMGKKASYPRSGPRSVVIEGDHVRLVSGPVSQMSREEAGHYFARECKRLFPDLDGFEDVFRETFFAGFARLT